MWRPCVGVLVSALLLTCSVLLLRSSCDSVDDAALVVGVTQRASGVCFADAIYVDGTGFARNATVAVSCDVGIGWRLPVCYHSADPSDYAGNTTPSAQAMFPIFTIVACCIALLVCAAFCVVQARTAQPDPGVQQTQMQMQMQMHPPVYARVPGLGH
jgi:hypothetical protein